MHSIHLKATVLVVAAVILVIEGFFVYGFYRSNSGGGVTSSSLETTMGETTAPENLSPEDEKPENEAGSAPEGTTFVHRATPGNTSSNSTFLDNPSVNGNPNAVLLVTQVSDSDGDEDDAHEIGVWYYEGGGRWAIFNQDLAPMSGDAVFNVIALEGAGTVVHRATPANIVGDSTFLDDPLTNRSPKALLSVTQNWNPGGGAGTYNDHPVTARYEAGRGQWAIFNRDFAEMPENASFNIAVSSGQ